jgi:phage shock protein PspC (stress-responsive transcriptional regulator)
MADADAMTEQTALMDDAGAAHDTGAGFPPPHRPTPQPWYRVPIARDPDDDMLGGVVSGLCRAYGFDRRTTRIALVIAAMVLPVVILAYVVAWVLLPDGPAAAQPLEDIVRDKRRFPLYAAIALVILVGGIGSLGSWLVFGDFPWGVGLIAIGVLLWIAPGLRKERTGAAPAATATAATATSWPAPADAGSTGAMPESGGDATTRLDPAATVDAPTTRLGTTAANGATLVAPAMPEARRRRRIPIGSIAVLATAAFVAVAAAGDAIDWWNVPVLGVVVTSLVVLATGFGISAVVNRAWFFTPIVVLFAAAAAALATASPSLDGGTGDRVVRPTTIAAAEELHDLGAGQLTLDLVDVPLDGDTVTVRAEVGVGRLHVVVPAGVELVITSDVGVGHVVIGDREVFAGVDQSETRTVEPVGEAIGTIELDLRVGMGEIDVDRDTFDIGAIDDIDAIGAIETLDTLDTLVLNG